MNDVSMIVAGVAFALAVIGCIAGFTAVALVVGLKNSTHKIEYRPVEVPKDPFAEEETEEEVLEKTFNPNKRLKIVEESRNDQEDFADLDDPTTTSNEWN